MKRGWVEIGGRAVGVPGTVAVLFEAHRRYGHLPWRNLFAPAIRLAEQGFTVSPRLAAAIADAPRLLEDPMARQLYFRQAETGGAAVPLQVGTTLENPAYGFTLRRIAMDGPQAFYTGEVAAAIVSRVRGHQTNPGVMTVGDLATYVAPERDAACRSYRGLSAVRHAAAELGRPDDGLMILECWSPTGSGDLHTERADGRRIFSRRSGSPSPIATAIWRMTISSRCRAGRRAISMSASSAIDPGRDMGEAQPGQPEPVAVAQASDSDRGRSRHQPSRHRRSARQCRGR